VQRRVYREAAARAERPARAVLRRDIFVAETAAAAHEEVDEEVMVRHITGDHEKMLRSFALIGRHVMLAIRAL
jgi:alkanesulfonate monooxygenase SsuD/methylene tetrahydromethanopterin reductase-like flavin-dependent oxidoreductase (luciferase family)